MGTDHKPTQAGTLTNKEVKGLITQQTINAFNFLFEFPQILRSKVQSVNMKFRGVENLE